MAAFEGGPGTGDGNADGTDVIAALGFGVGVIDGATEPGATTVGSIDGILVGVGVGLDVGRDDGNVEGAPAATTTHVCVEYALVLSKHELLEHEVAAHVALKGTIDVVDTPVQVEVVE